MYARRSQQQPFSSRSANTLGTRSHLPPKVELDDDTRNSRSSSISGLTDLENDADDLDDFDRRMMQEARDRRRLEDAARGKVQPFRKARTHPRVGLTMENLERHESRAQGGPASRRGPSSSSGASDPAIRPPASWGSKARVRRNWLRTFASEAEQELGAQEDIVDQLAGTTPRVSDTAAADGPRASVEDSPLARKSSIQGTPSATRHRNARFEDDSDIDLSIDFNEASMIASTPYVSRNPILDDIRQREIESSRDQAATTSRQANGHIDSSEKVQKPISSSVGQERDASTATRGEIRRHISPVVVYKKTAETVGVVDPSLLANEQRTPELPSRKKEDHHNLLRRLARASSNTPSPARPSEERAESAAPRRDSASPEDTLKGKPPVVKDVVIADLSTRQPSLNEPSKASQEQQPGPPPPEPVDVDATSAPVEPSILQAKTPRVTGAWIDTPKPITNHKIPEEPLQLPSPPPERPTDRSPIKRSPRKPRASGTSQDAGQPQPMEPTRPKLPRSALQAIVEEAKANGQTPRHEDQLGDSTIDSLEDLISPANELEGAEADEDTLQGLQVPTQPPRNEAERLRHKELLQLQQMNQRLRNARTSIRDASRGMKKVEHQVEHMEGNSNPTPKPSGQGCPCTSNGHQNPWAIAWSGFTRLFYKPEARRTYGLTWLSVALLTFVAWFVSELLACEKYCHKMYAPRMVGFGVAADAPRFPFVVPTLIYRNLQRPWGLLTWPLKLLWSMAGWIWGQVWDSFFDADDADAEVVKRGATSTIRKVTTTVLQQAQGTYDEPDFDFGFGDDEFI